MNTPLSSTLSTGDRPAVGPDNLNPLQAPAGLPPLDATARQSHRVLSFLAQHHWEAARTCRELAFVAPGLDVSALTRGYAHHSWQSAYYYAEARFILGVPA